MLKRIKKWWKKFWDGIEHRRELKRIKKALEKGEDPFTY